MRVQAFSAVLALVFTGSAIAFAATGNRIGVRPDLVVSSVSNPPAVVVPGHSFQTHDRTRNAGRAAAGPTVTRYYLSADGRRTAVGHRSVPRLRPARSSAAAGTVKAAVEPGVYSLVACADGGAAVRESNERDNVRKTRVELSADRVEWRPRRPC